MIHVSKKQYDHYEITPIEFGVPYASSFLHRDALPGWIAGAISELNLLGVGYTSARYGVKVDENTWHINF